MRVFQHIWAFWGVLVFSTLLLLVLPFFAFGILIWGQKAIQKVHIVSRIWAGGIFALCGIIPKNIGSLKLNDKSPYVMVSNHLSALDIPLCAWATARPFRFLAKAELGKIPVLGWIIRNIYMTVDRGNAKARIESLERMKTTLNEGTSLFIFPEGTRNIGDLHKTAKFYDGAFRLAIDSQQPIAVLVIYSGKNLCPNKGFRLKPGIIRYEWVEILPVKGLEMTNMSELKDTTKKLMDSALIKVK